MKTSYLEMVLMYRILELVVGHDSVKLCVPTSICWKLGGHQTESDGATEEAPVWTRRDSTQTLYIIELLLKISSQ